MAGRVCSRKVHSIIIQARDKPTHQYEATIKILKEKQVIVLLFPRLVQDLKVIFLESSSFVKADFVSVLQDLDPDEA